MVGYDLDGTLCEENNNIVNKIMFKLLPNRWAKFKHSKAKLSFLGRFVRDMDEKIIIITGRPIQDKEYTLKWLDKVGIKADVYFSPHYDQALKHKLDMISKLNITKFYENDEKQVLEIEKIIPCMYVR